MRLTSIYAAAGLAGLIAATHPATAGDLSNGAAGGISDYNSGGVPVPIPKTYEENFKWYARADIGTALKTTGTLGNDGLPLTLNQPGDWHELSIISFGFGKYVSPNVRVEATLDYRPERPIAAGTKATPDTTQRFASATEIDVNVLHGVQNENINYQNTTLLMSGFYDFNSIGRFRPYVGAGVGIAVHQLRRSGTDAYVCDNALSSSTVGGVPTPGCLSTNGLQTSYVVTSNQAALGYGLAAQLSAGLTYDITPRTHLDTGYRMVWQSGRLSVASMDGLSTVRLNDQINHEVRTGIRWDIW